MTSRMMLLISGLLGSLAVILGAIGAHWLAGTDGQGFLQRRYADTPPKVIAGQTVTAAYKYLGDFQTAAAYHMTHSIALGIAGLLATRRRSRWLTAAAWSFLGGIVFFSGAIYLLVIAGPRWLGIPWGAIAPIGGTLMIVGWICLAVSQFTEPFISDSVFAE